MQRSYFGTDGVRGRANHFPMTAEVAMRIGLATGMLFQRGADRHRVVVGKDTRLSCYMIESALVAGFCAAGMDVFLLGPVPTPAVAMLVRSLRADVGIMVSASHNSYEDNGIKLFGPDGYKLSRSIEDRIEQMIESGMHGPFADSHQLGKVKRVDGVCDRYIEFAKRTLPKSLSLSGLRIAVDCANGGSYKVAPATFWELGAEVFPINIQPNGLNINDQCGSSFPEQLQKKVLEVSADIGFAFDGDGDRLIVVDEKGTVIDGDQIIALLAENWRKAGILLGGGVVSTIMSNLGLERYLQNIGLELRRTQVGDRHVSEYMRTHGFNIGGEPSGHIILSDLSTTGDALVSALQILNCIKKNEKSVSELCHKFEPVPQILKNVKIIAGKPLESRSVKEVINDARARLEPHGRLVIRPSGTEKLIRVMAEGNDSTTLETIVNDIVRVIEKVPSVA